MLFLIFMGVLAAAAAGLAVKYLLDYRQSEKEITWKEYVLGMAGISILVVPGVAKIGWEMVRSDTVSFNEYWNGWELEATKKDIICSRDGPCGNEYDCDPYLVSYPCNCDDKGNCGTCYRTEYHSCPYTTFETNYYVHTTLGDYTIATHRFPLNPTQHRWRRSHSIPDGVIQRAGTGEPPFWRAVYDRVRTGRPGPVTARRAYDNYILASDRTILHQYSSAIEKFRQRQLLPDVQFKVHDFYLADKLYLVGFRPSSPQYWQKAVAYLNAALGAELQGDLHLVLVQNEMISSNPDTYTLALRAYWLNKEAQSKNAFAKNGIGIVIGTKDGQTVAWARAFTGMPAGNEALAVAVNNRLKGVAMTSEAVVGNLRGWFKTPLRVESIHSGGVLESIIWGFSNPATKFRRYSMGSNNRGLGGGYFYLMGEIQPKSHQKFWIGFWTFFASGLVWLALAIIGERTYKQRSYNNKNRKDGHMKHMRRNEHGALGIGAIIGISACSILLVSVVSLYKYAADIRTEAVQREITLSTQYLSNQNYLSTYISGFYEQLGLVKYKTDKFDQILTDYVKGRNSWNSGQSGQAGFLYAVAEAVPNLEGLNIVDRLMDYVQAQREGYRNIQDKLLDQLRAYDSWRQEGLFRVWVLGNFFPSKQLVARVGGRAIAEGPAAREKMYQIVLTAEATKSYETGTMAPLQVK